MANPDSVDPFHWCAMAAGSIARDHGRLGDSEYVKHLTYALYEAARKFLCEQKQ